ncbi:histidinol-phosphate aminotransferase family protein [Parapedobacter sp. ISTM3]|nr:MULTISPECIES: histidinol-phosphate transaminase [Parapedobacter]MBK1442084.1 histidinol-phosphate aminotransferase family protein [Parapedobacter sp. ISTM3]
MTNRRTWIKSSLLAAGGLALAPSLSLGKNKVAAATASPQGILRDITLPWDDTAPAMQARLSANENPYGPSESVRKAVADAVGFGNRYGHEDAARLIDMIAEKEGVTRDYIMLGPGSTDLLEKTAISLFLKGGNIVSADPSYMSMMNTTRAIGGTWKPVPLTADYAHDLDAMAAAVDSETRLIYVCNPNNPLGSITSAAALKQFCSTVSAKVPVFIDEAYLEFLPDPAANTMVGLVAQGKDVIVARTFSKIHSMAGLRIGYIVAQPERIKSLNSIVRGTMGLCVTSLSGAIASMQDKAFQENSRKLNLECREYLCNELKTLGYPYIPSLTNFVIFPIKSDAQAFQGKLREGGVSVRMFEIDEKPWCRVSMGTMPEMELFTNVLKKITV